MDIQQLLAWLNTGGLIYVSLLAPIVVLSVCLIVGWIWRGLQRQRREVRERTNRMRVDL